MASDETERLLAEIGQRLAEDHEYPLDGTLLLAELDRNWVAPSIFKELGNQILFRWADHDRICGPLLDLWEAQDTDDRWAEMAYVVRDGRFEVSYTYPDEIDPDQDPMDRRDRVVRRYFGEKPIVYPTGFPDDGLPTYDV